MEPRKFVPRKLVRLRYCPNVRNIWDQLKFNLAEDLTLPPQYLQAAVFGFSEKDNTESEIIYNHLFLIVKLYVYRSREKGLLNPMSLVNQVIIIKKMKKKTPSILKKRAISMIRNGAKQI